jgi:hypothetical protein
MDKDGPLDGRKRMKIMKIAKRGKSHQKKYFFNSYNSSKWGGSNGQDIHP